MHDAVPVRRLQRRGDLRTELERFLDGERPALQPGSQLLTVEQLHDERGLAVDFWQVVQRRHVRVVQPGEQARLAAEARQPLGVFGHGARDRLQGDGPVEPRVACAPHLAHAAATEE